MINETLKQPMLNLMIGIICVGLFLHICNKIAQFNKNRLETKINEDNQSPKTTKP